ncbi:MAG: chromosome segregation protein SMC [Alphaproteobacteria bacterium]|nr:chromosome segregation protein SMC [Alphaproteobacteria bacterium]
MNGKTVRARDVQMLFADTVTGANSPSMVSQGHVTRMINAKPQERRLILEESAGIAGLYARRHEAELRLKAADTNLQRLEDIMNSMESRLSSLKRQARQASKYKNLNAQIRQFELLITYLEWQSLTNKQKDYESEFSKTESIVAEKLIAVTQLTKTQNTQIEDLPPLRKRESEISAALQAQKLTLQRMEDEAETYEKNLRDLKNQLEQIKVDLTHEDQTLTESNSALEKTISEQEDLIKSQDNEDDNFKQKQSAKENIETRLLKLEERYTALKEDAAETRARQSALENQISRNQQQKNILVERKESAETKLEILERDNSSSNNIEEVEFSIAELQDKIIELNTEKEHKLNTLKSAEEKLEEERGSYANAQKNLAEFRAELSTLQSLFNQDESENQKSILDSISTTEGFETALSRALGDSLTACIIDESPDAPASWRIKKLDVPELPGGIKSLKPYIKAPKELDLALSQIGIVEEDSQGEQLAADLKAGQSLVSKAGTYWRWDGYSIKASATDRHAVYLEQKNKLQALKKKEKAIEDQALKLESQLEKQKAQKETTKESYESCLRSFDICEKQLNELNRELGILREKNTRNENDRQKLQESIELTNKDIASLNDILEHDQKALSIMLDKSTDEQSKTIEAVETELTEVKQDYRDALREFDLIEQHKRTREARLQALADERISLQNRVIRAKERKKTFGERAVQIEEKYKSLKDSPQNFKKGHEALLEKISQMEEQKNQATEQLTACENDVSTTNKALKEAENILGDAREERARIQATLSAVNENLKTLEQNIQEKLEIKPQELVHHAAMDLVKYKIEDLENIKAEKTKLERDREMIGPVNLRAEDESNELEKEVTTLLHERNDLIQAIEELRGGIEQINKEARERLRIAFEKVNAHFQELFVRLFSGGKAHLELIDSDDPLGSGLEIFAQPPGKALQSLSLLSGGEQTLTSIALIFSMFLTNPSPICVLDEIDAPLDDTNVDRVCDLLEEITERSKTRFLIITHHRLSMARMDRLYGVTMAEKGVSQLVSVDLQQSFNFIDKDAA